MEFISSYVLTKNSQKYLAEILDKLTLVADEIFIIDSGSQDTTQELAMSYSKVKFLFHSFENFKQQRIFAEEQCSYDNILFVDSDEIPDEQMVDSLLNLKENGIDKDAYRIKRVWQVLGKNVSTIYPVKSPDFPIRLYKKGKVSFKNSNLVHEDLSGFSTVGVIKGSLRHKTFHTKEELFNKLELYTSIAANDLIRRKKTIGLYKVVLSPIAAFIKWYIFKQGYKDGRIGLLLGKYAYLYTLKKYIKARKNRYPIEENTQNGKVAV